MVHEKHCAGRRQGAESVATPTRLPRWGPRGPQRAVCARWGGMARRRVLRTVSRSSAFPGCGAVSESNEASWLMNVHAYTRRTDDPIVASAEIAWKSAALRNAARDPRWVPNPARQSRCARVLPAAGCHARSRLPARTVFRRQRATQNLTATPFVSSKDRLSHDAGGVCVSAHTLLDDWKAASRGNRSRAKDDCRRKAAG